MAEAKRQGIDLQSKREGWVSIRQLGAEIVCVVRKALWAPVAVLGVHEVAAATFGHEPHVDIIAHFLGGVASAFFIHHTSVIFRRNLFCYIARRQAAGRVEQRATP